MCQVAAAVAAAAEEEEEEEEVEFNIRGKRGRFERADAEAAVRKAGAAVQSRCRRVCLSTQSITAAAAEVLGPYLRGMGRRSVGGLGDIISGIPEAEAIRTLASHKTLNL